MESEAADGQLVAVVDFHHARGPEVEFWLGGADNVDPAKENDWTLLPFMALSDGAHTTTEEFSYFTLVRKATDTLPATSLFGISCTRQIAASNLKNKALDVTRSTVQKAVIVITAQPQRLGQLRERLSAVTTAWFAQGDFSDVDILKKFKDSLANSGKDGNSDGQHLGLSLREIIHDFKYQTLVLFKCCLLQPKMLFFASRCERLCLDCADPVLDTYAQTVSKASQLKTSERSSLLAYVGLPLQIFGKDAFFGPYTPLQQLDLLPDCRSYIVGSTNSLLLQQKDRYSDILINLDDLTVNITSPSLRSALSLSAADRRWIDFLTKTVIDTWDPTNPSRPSTMGFTGSEEFIRLQFEEYLLSLLSSVSFSLHKSLRSQSSSANDGRSIPADRSANSDPTVDYNAEFISAWKLTSNFALFSRLTTGSALFDLIEPKHPTAGGLSAEDVQRRLAQQVAELHLDERMREGRETLNKSLLLGREKFGHGINKLWADIEAIREAQRSRSVVEKNPVVSVRDADGELSSNEVKQNIPASGAPNTHGSGVYTWTSSIRDRASKVQRPDLSQVQASAKDGAAKAGAYLSSWGSWAKERGKEWQEKRNNDSTGRAS